ncbi:MAG: hypothetical protein JWP87_3284 [Labilithrix sp.]|nr:hypothetical protein [Labilithrix sp.]
MGAPEPSGRVVGRYAVFDEIAAGGTGERLFEGAARRC